MTSATSLEASAEAYLAMGMEVDAAFCKRMAEDARNNPPWLGGEALFDPWATQQAERASAKLQQFNERRAA